MFRLLSGGLLLITLLATSACNRAPESVILPGSGASAPIPALALTGTISMPPTSDVLIGRTSS